MSNRRLYSGVVSGSPGESSGEEFAEGQSRQPTNSVCNWLLLAYQTDREDVALEKTLELSEVISFHFFLFMILHIIAFCNYNTCYI